jgi:hypothetical protein
MDNTLEFISLAATTLKDFNIKVISNNYLVLSCNAGEYNGIANSFEESIVRGVIYLIALHLNERNKNETKVS